MTNLTQIPEYIPNSCYGCHYNKEDEPCSPLKHNCKKGFIWDKGRIKIKDILNAILEKSITKLKCPEDYGFPRIECLHDCKACWEESLTALDIFKDYIEDKTNDPRTKDNG